MEGRKFPLCPKGCLFGGQNRLCGPDCRGGVQSADRPNAQANRRRLEFFVGFGRGRRGESVVSAAGAVSALTASSLDLSSDAAEIVRHMQKLRTIVTALVITALAAFPAAGASAAMVMPMTTPMTTPMATPGTTSVAATASQDGMSGDCMRHADEMQSHDRTPSRDIVPGQDSAAPVKADEKGPCSHRGACGNKCLCLGLAISAVLPAGPGTAAAPLASVAPVRLASPVRSLSGIPPSPPPRV